MAPLFALITQITPSRINLKFGVNERQREIVTEAGVSGCGWLPLPPPPLNYENTQKRPRINFSYGGAA
jgi:hypothetical protein